MSSILIVESKNDQQFLQFLINHLNYEIEVDAPICIDDDYECLDGLSEGKLITTLRDLDENSQKRDFEKIGIIIDQDHHSQQERLDFINRCLEQVFKLETKLTTVNQWINIESFQGIPLQLACHFTNVDGHGELETLLKQIKSHDSPYADCLADWRDCLQNQGLQISKKDFDKFWWNQYIRYDTCSKQDRKQAGKKCSMQNFNYILEHKGSNILNLNHQALQPLKDFLELFR